ncbi:MAG: hypothetical protein AB7F35_19565 [Acetobacteraceae bacterium]
MQRFLLVALLAAGLAGTARADWQYTRWGMTPEQVVRASGGKVSVLPKADRRRVEDANLETSATGTFQDGTLSLRVMFSFDTRTGGLACVFHGVMDPRENDAFKALLLRRHGPPQDSSALPAIGQETMNWKLPADEIDLTVMTDDRAFATQCKPD